MSTNTEATTGEKIATLSRWIDDSYPEMNDELVMRRRIGKIGNEFGEVLDALEGATGENPRKGVFDTYEHVAEELLDVAITALGAWEHVTGNDGTSSAALDDKITRILERAGLAALLSSTSPEASDDELARIWYEAGCGPEGLRAVYDFAALRATPVQDAD